MTMPEEDLYAILGLAEGVTALEIKSAYRRKALRLHPDKLAATLSAEEREEATASFQRVGRAYAILGDEKRRERYDRTGSVEEDIFPEGADALAEYFAELYEKLTLDKLEDHAATYRGTSMDAFRGMCQHLRRTRLTPSAPPFLS
jgi:DnaJ family protein C protein 9